MPTIARGSPGRAWRFTSAAICRTGSPRSRSPKAQLGNSTSGTNTAIGSCSATRRAGPWPGDSRAASRAASSARANSAAASSSQWPACNSAASVGISGSLIKGNQRGEARKASASTAVSDSVSPQAQRPAPLGGSWAVSATSRAAAGIAGSQ